MVTSIKKRSPVYKGYNFKFLFPVLLYKINLCIFNMIKPLPWGIKGENNSFLPSLSPAVKSFTPFIGVYIVW